MSQDPIVFEKVARKKYYAAAAAQPITVGAAVEDTIANPETSIIGKIGIAGTTLLGHAPDTCSLDMEEYSMGVAYSYNGNTYYKPPASPFREDTKLKLPASLRNEVMASYEALNAFMVRCTPNEYKTNSPQAPLRDPVSGMLLTPNDFRFLGDSSTYMCLVRVAPKVDEIIRGTLGNSYFLSDFLAPVSENTAVEPSVYNKKIEGKNITVDILGSKIVPVDTVLETKALS